VTIVIDGGHIMSRILVIANETLRAKRLLDHLHERALVSPQCELRLVAPLRLPMVTDVASLGCALPLDTLDLAAIAIEAQDRLRDTVDELAATGIAVTGTVTTSDPLTAIDFELRRGPVDEIIFSTKPLPLSRWLHLDLPRRAAKRHRDVVVTVIENVPAALAH
jgi:hypothetical protein